MLRERLLMALAGLALATSGCVEAKPFVTPEGDAQACTADCTGRVCGDDGCGGICGSCPADAIYCVNGSCSAQCEVSCEGKECGDDGCGVSCGTCPGAAPYCEEGLCSATCTPVCDGKECGADSCGGVCGHCPEAAPVCDPWFKCVTAGACVPQCDGRECGDDGCGGTCGTCQDDGLACNGEEVCHEGLGTCEQKDAPLCDDENPCTIDTCSESGTADPCVHEPVSESVPCDDGDECTTGDTCNAGACNGTPWECDDENECTVDTCDAEMIGSDDPCVYTNLTEQECDDGDDCTVSDTCFEGSCGGVPKACDNGTFCDGFEACDPIGGECVSSEPLVCQPGSECQESVEACAWLEKSACHEEDGEIAHCLLVSDNDIALGQAVADSDDDGVVGDGSSPTMQAGIAVLQDEEGESEIAAFAFSVMSFDSPWGLFGEKKPDHRIHGTLMLWASPDSPVVSEPWLSLFRVILTNKKLNEDDDGNLAEAMAGVGAKFISTGPPSVETDPLTGATVWMFPIELEPDEVVDTIQNSVGVGPDLQIFEAGTDWATAPGLVNFYTKESVDDGVGPNLIPRLLLEYTTCAADCTDKSCGSDGCEGVCGVCPAEDICVELDGMGFCCQDEACAEGAACGTSPCGVTCDANQESELLCSQGQLLEEWQTVTCANSGCDVAATVDVSRKWNSFWADGDPVIPIFESVDESFQGRYEALAYFPGLEDAVETQSPNTQGDAIYLKLWFAHDVEPGGPYLQFQIPGLWHDGFGNVTDATMIDAGVEEESDSFAWEESYLGASEPIYVSDDGAFVYALEGLHVDAESDKTAKLATHGVLINLPYGEDEFVLLRTTESGFGPQLTWNPLECVQFCEGKECGPDGCGGSCGQCDMGTVCDDLQATGSFLCVEPVCEPGALGCDGDELIRCDELGTGFILDTLCSQDLMLCQENADGEAACGPNPLENAEALSVDPSGGIFSATTKHEALQGTVDVQQDASFTLSFWVYVEQTKDYGVLASYGGTPGEAYFDEKSTSCAHDESGWVLYVEDGRLQFKTADIGAGTARLSSTGPKFAETAGAWVHIAVVSTGAVGEFAHRDGNVRLYVNGIDRWNKWKEVTSQNQEPYGGMTPIEPELDFPGFVLGAAGCPSLSSSVWNTKGSFDEVAVYTTALGQQDINTLFGGGCGGSAHEVHPDQLALWWSFDGLDPDVTLESGDEVENAQETTAGDGADGVFVGNGSGVATERVCGAPLGCDLEDQCGAGCEPCPQGEICNGLGWCVLPSCLEPPEDPAPPQGCSSACGSGLSGCGMTAFCGYGCGHGTCGDDVAEDVALFKDGTSVAVGRICETSICQVAVWRYNLDGSLMDQHVFVDLGGQSGAFTGQAGMEEGALGVDVADDGSGAFAIAGWTTTAQDNFDNGTPHRRPMLVYVNADLSVEWVWVDPFRYGAFNDVSLNSAATQFEYGGESLEVPPYTMAVGVGYHTQWWWNDLGVMVTKKAGLVQTVHYLGGVAIPGQVAVENWAPTPSDLNDPDIGEGASFRGSARLADGTVLYAGTTESANYDTLDSLIGAIGFYEMGYWNVETIEQAWPAHDIRYLDISTTGKDWYDGKERVYVVYEKTAAPDPTQVFVRQYAHDESSGNALELEVENLIDGDFDKVEVSAICAAGPVGFVLTGAVTTNQGNRRPFIQRRTANSKGVHWSHLVDYATPAAGALAQPGTSTDRILGCATRVTAEGDRRLMAVGEMIQPGETGGFSPLHDAYVASHMWSSGKSSCF